MTSAAQMVETYQSFAEFRASHTELLRKHHGDVDAELLDAIELHIRRGTVTGVLLDAEPDRREAQTLLDYWATVLDRAGHSSPDPTLESYDPALAPTLDDQLCPYRGLEAFRPIDRGVFFGRLPLIAEMVDRLRSDRFLAVVGPSGSGKSSVVLAGLLPALADGAIAGSQDWRLLGPVVPGSDPLGALVRLMLATGDDADVNNHAKQLRRDPAHLAALIGGASPAVLVIDQFEEVFTLTADKDDRAAFIKAVVALTETSSARHSVALTLRSDYESNVAAYPALQARFRAGASRVTALGPAELREAIELPAASIGLKFEEGLVDQLVTDFLGEPAGLPLLQFTLLKLWGSREKNRITLAAYRKLGGGRHALAKSADELWNSLLDEGREVAERIFMRLVQPSEGLEVTRRRVCRSELHRTGYEPGRVDRVLDRLVQSRLVRLTPGVNRSDDRIEVAHEALVRNWPRLTEWLDKERQKLRHRLQLDAAAQLWEARNRDSQLLLPLKLAVEASHYDDLTTLEQQYVSSSKAHHARLRRATIAVWATLLAGAVAVVVAGAFLWGVGQRQTERNRRLLAEEQRHAAEDKNALLNVKLKQQGDDYERHRAEKAEETNRQLLAANDTAKAAVLATGALSHLESDPERSLLLARAAVAMSRSWLTERALNEALQKSRVRLLVPVRPASDSTMPVALSHRRLVTGRGSVATVWDRLSRAELTRLSGHTRLIRAIVFSADETRIGTASDDSTARIWDAASGKQLLSMRLADEITALAFSPNGSKLAAGTAGGHVVAWQAATGAKVFDVASQSGEVNSVAYSRDGTRIVIGSDDHTAEVFDAWSGARLLTLDGHTGTVYGAAFTPDDRRIATVSWDGSLRIWDAWTGESVLVRRTHRGPIVSLAADTAGLMATGGYDHTIKIWDTHDWTEVETLSGHGDVVSGLAYTRAGTFVASASWDGTARVWDVSTRAVMEMYSAQGPHGNYAIAVSPRERARQFATAGMDGSVWIWNTDSAAVVDSLPGHRSDVSAIAYDPSGERLASASYDSSAMIWHLASRDTVRLQHKHVVRAIAFTPDGGKVLTGVGDGTAQLWNATTGARLRTLRHGEDRVYAVAVRPDGAMFATAGRDGKVALWDSAGRLLDSLPHSKEVWDVTFSPNNAHVVTTISSGQVTVWDLRSLRKIRVLSGHIYVPFRARFSPNGSYLATASWDRSIRVWDAKTWKPLFVYSSRSGAVNDVAFDQKTGRLLSVTMSTGVHYNTLDFRQLVAIANRRVTRSLTAEECREYSLDCASLDSAVKQYTGRLERETERLALSDFRSVPQALKLLARGRDMAEQGRLGVAVSTMREALRLDPRLLATSPDSHAARLRRDYLRVTGNYLARGGDTAFAARQFSALKAMGGYVDPDRTTRRSRNYGLMQDAWIAVENGHVDDAIAIYERLSADSAHYLITATEWNQLCWFGSLWNQAPKVMSACERAVRLYPSSGGIRDSRGVARALTGDLKGAIEDFQAFVDQKIRNNEDDSEAKQRKDWIVALNAGRSPFTNEVLKELRRP